MSPILIDPSLSYIKGTQRVMDGGKTLELVQSGLDNIGVTRVANITDLDRVGIPVFSTIRPSAADGAISVYSGKGASSEQARISAIMESYERCLAERVGFNANISENIAGEEFIESPEVASEEHRIIDPASLLLAEPLGPGSLVEWTQGFDLLSNEEVFVPSNAVYHPYNSPGRSSKLFRSNTNGLAAGNVMEEALLHGILEVIERDALSMAEFNRNPGKELQLSGEDGVNYELLSKFREAGVDVKLWVVTHDSPITTVVVATDDIELRDPALLVMGAGAHLDPAIAVRRALSEAAQSRVVQIHGAREDTAREEFVRQIGYDRMKRMNGFWYEDGYETITLKKLDDLSASTPAQNIETVLNHLRKITDRVIAVDLSRESIPVPVVRIIIPGFEQYTLDRERVGKRIRLVGKRKGLVEDKPWKRRPKI
ncbi:ribosomal protein S12 methylthiotransferase accessory factor [Methanohalophilus levihalophilus]|uniref:YcaO-related McrA-glycine thioamidation protein n=1 Tax=Methanohalophilus levihalophilus TaxID=1431282 RepID=UPI001AE50828|nr:YcaO-related McrA-glycine thioamidation protein [Methanohalophilus levihalophilus]MBP2030140.1 ribosomal protein S12 methylthiotransferase accessory factor [Methanohalophilus levihalophilus]